MTRLFIITAIVILCGFTYKNNPQTGKPDLVTTSVADLTDISTGYVPTSVFTNYTSNDRITPNSTHSLTNKTINDLTNYVDADAVHFKIYNNSGGTLAAGSPVYGVQWNIPNAAMEVNKAQANSASTMPALCLVESSLANGAKGECRIVGALNNVNTNAWSDGAALYVSAATAGTLTTTKPTGATEIVQRVGTSVRQSATVGVIAVYSPDTNVLNKKFIIQTADTDLPNAQNMAALATGIVKNTTATGVQSIAVAGDFPTLNQNTTGTAFQITQTLTASVSTTPTTIYNYPSGYVTGLFIVSGNDVNNYFIDIVSGADGGNTVVLHSSTVYGTPSARTYSMAGGSAFKLTMSSGTYKIRVIPNIFLN